MSLQNAEANLKEFANELQLKGLAFDENHTCILGIDNTFSLHLTYETASDRLYLYSPILDGLPKDDSSKLKLYEALLEGSILGGQMAGGGVGVAIKEELILMHCVLEMGPGADPSFLRRFAPLFVESVEKWRERAKNIIEGRDSGATGVPGGGPVRNGQKPGKGDNDHPKPGDRFIKI
ncbi:MAG: CesT family type III secretion system chaperone [Simkaniaceae bacterium]|nr:CesT family type III secretion system chaperone [Simkaniaceae bacterium]